MQIQFFIHLRVLIKSFYLAKQFEVPLVQDEATLLSPFKISIFAGIFLDDFIAFGEFLKADAGGFLFKVQLLDCELHSIISYNLNSNDHLASIVY